MYIYLLQKQKRGNTGDASCLIITFPLLLHPLGSPQLSLISNLAHAQISLMKAGGSTVVGEPQLGNGSHPYLAQNNIQHLCLHSYKSVYTP